MTAIPTKILIVDDILKNLQVIANILKQHGYHIEFASDGETALEWADTQDFDLILLDIMMPEMDGFEVCKQLKSKEKTKDIPVIFLTAKDDMESIKIAFQLGGVDFISKPFNSEELIARVKTHVTINSQRKRLIELNHTKDLFFSIISHDIKTPFAIVMSNTKLLQDKFNTYKPETILKLLKNTHESSKYLYGLLLNLLEWSRLQMGKKSAEPKKLNLQYITERALEILGPSIEKKSLKIENEINRDMNAYGDEDMIMTVIRNLLSNAVKFSFDGEKIFLQARKENNHIIYKVKDKGIGMTEEDMSKLFRIEVHNSEIGNSPEKGSGLGLILCKELVNKNNGEIWVESEPGKGSVFSFTLPEV